jgi:hypothetical protein
VKAIIIGHVFIQTKFCVGGEEETKKNFIINLTLTNYYLFYVNIRFVHYFQVIYGEKMVWRKIPS